MSLDRIIPDLSKMICIPIIGPKSEDKTEDNYLDKITKFEIGCEKSIIETLGKLDINASVKSDRYSLPYKSEVKVTLYGESYMNGPFEFFRVARKIAKELLNEDARKIRFYMFINICDRGARIINLGSVEYCFRYYTH